MRVNGIRLFIIGFSISLASLLCILKLATTPLLTWISFAFFVLGVIIVWRGYVVNRIMSALDTIEKWG